MNLHLTENDHKILISILKKYKNDFKFYAFGSRVRGDHKQYSDLDLAIIPLTQNTLTQIKNDLEDSNLSITIDLIELDKIDASFKQIVQQEMVQFDLD